MTTTFDPADLDAREREADRAAAARRIAQARTLLRSVVDADPSRIDSWLKLAAMCRAAGDLPAAHRAIAGALAVDPLHFIALLSRARLHDAAGDQAEAARGYIRALAQLEPDGAVPPALHSAVEHARVVSARYTQDVASTWDRAIDAGVLEAAERQRLMRFKSNALRQTRVYHCEPTHYHYPGLAEREFHDREDFPWLVDLEAATPMILAEFEALAHERAARAEPYIRYGSDVPVRQWAALNNSLDWTAFHLIQGGRIVAENAARCPETMKVLARIDQPAIVGRSPQRDVLPAQAPHAHSPAHRYRQHAAGLPLALDRSRGLLVQGRRRNSALARRRGLRVRRHDRA